MRDRVTVTIDQETGIHQLLVEGLADVLTDAQVTTTNGGWRLVGRDEVYAGLNELVADLINAGYKAKRS
ncbi:MAG: hypothetical protein ACRBK7_16475 [Acidimicrobiales bacterium]